MDLSDIVKILEQSFKETDSSTDIGLYSKVKGKDTKGRDSLLTLLKGKNKKTRANAIWKMAEYVVAPFGDKKDPVKDYIEGWKNIASSTNDQYLLLEENPSQWAMYDAQGNRMGDERYIIDYFSKMKLNSSSPLQQIFYGAPGTGKSYEITKRTKGKDVIRTTFHPDSDYSTFVGAYKPTMEESDIIATPVVVSKGTGVFQSTSTYKENRISYIFVKQAFLKAYLSAWKKIGTQTPPHKNVSFRVFNAVYTIISVDDKVLQQKKTDLMRKSKVRNTWDNDLWETGSFKIPTGRRPGASVQEAISNGIMAIDPSFTKDDFDKGWDSLLSELKAKNTISVSASKREYELSLGENDDYVLFSTVAKNTKARIEKCYNEEDEEPKGVESGIIDILNAYDVNTFDEAWKKLEEDVMGSTPASENLIAPQFLIIEEINRGNCAQIFGDIFQLLDRQGNGFSEYPIEADSDLQEAIAKELQGADIKVDWALANYKSTINGSTLSEDIKAGRILLLPNNLYIWATMNTSDQSLFPMDSAFKRRWDWECIPIDYNNEKSKNFTITINGKKFNWHDFLEKVNERILRATGSEDKQMGNFFIKGDVDEKQFINKVMFYLWNDVCKEEYGTNNNFFRYYKDSEKKEEQFTEQFTFNKLFENDVKNTKDKKDTFTLDKFMLYLGVDDEETKKKKLDAGEVVEHPVPEPVPEP